MTIGENIKNLRKEKKLTQQEMADLIGISRTYLTDIESNRKNLGSKTLKDLSEKLDISMMYLTTGRKTVGDLTEEELKEQFKKVKQNRTIEMQNFKEKLQKDLSKLEASDLSHADAQLLTHILWFINDNPEKDKKQLSTFLFAVNKNKNILLQDDVDSEEVFDDIEETTQFFKKFLMRRYGYEGD